jgi:aspartyl-tRNA(Asn)/glutamyl-tRNA(Gln) amidotransferase subunit C
MANPNAVTNVTRPDVIVPGLTPEQALSGAPAVEQDRFAVPQILGEGE